MDFGSLIIYGGILIISCSLSYIYERNKDLIYLILSYLSIAIFCAIRFDVGWDYAGYVDIFYMIKNYDVSYVEPAYYYLNSIFKDFDRGYLYPIGAMSLLNIGALFWLYYKEKNLWRNVYFLFCFQLIFQINDQIRQGLAMAIIWIGLYSLNGKANYRIIRYVICVSCASLFHMSSIFFLLVIFVRKINLRSYLWTVLLILGYALYLLGYSDYISNLFSNYLFLYDKYENSLNIQVSDYSNPFIILFWTLIGIIIANSYNGNNKLFYNLNMLGTVIYPVVSPIHLLERIDFYLLFLNTLLSAEICKRKSLSGQLLIILGAFIFIIYCLMNWGTAGGYPYYSIFSNHKI